MKINHRDTTNSVERPALSVRTIWLSTEDEEWLSWIGLREYQMRFGSAQLKMGGICGVGTIIPVLGVLFPMGHPHVWWSDRF